MRRTTETTQVHLAGGVPWPEWAKPRLNQKARVGGRFVLFNGGGTKSIESLLNEPTKGESGEQGVLAKVDQAMVS